MPESQCRVPIPKSRRIPWPLPRRAGSNSRDAARSARRAFAPLRELLLRDSAEHTLATDQASMAFSRSCRNAPAVMAVMGGPLQSSGAGIGSSNTSGRGCVKNGIE
jgi:hypothetical protein